MIFKVGDKVRFRRDLLYSSFYRDVVFIVEEVYKNNIKTLTINSKNPNFLLSNRYIFYKGNFELVKPKKQKKMLELY